MIKFIVRHLVILTFMASVSILNSCQKEAEIHEADLIGTWDIGQASVDIKVGAISLIKFLRTALQLSEQEAEDYLAQLISEYDYISGGTITFDADYSYLMVNGDFQEQGTWELDKNKLYLTIPGENLDDEHLVIENLSSSSAHMVVEEDVPVDIDENGSTDFTATIIIEVDLSKQ